MTVRGGILEEARSLTEGDRNAAYGDPVPEYERLGRMWGAYLGVEISGVQAAYMMVMLKANRTLASPGRRDTHVDAAAYCAIAGECAERASER